MKLKQKNFYVEWSLVREECEQMQSNTKNY